MKKVTMKFNKEEKEILDAYKNGNQSQSPT